jgi:hypothetical protein
MNISAVAHVSTFFDEEEDYELQGTNEPTVIDTSYDPDAMDTNTSQHKSNFLMGTIWRSGR